MKKILPIIACLSILSCASNQEVKKNPTQAAYEAFVKESIDLPETFNFISMEKVDSTTYQELFDGKMELFTAPYYLNSEKALKVMDEVKRNLADTIGNVAAYKYKCAFSAEFPIVGEMTVVQWAEITPYNEVLMTSINEEDVYASPLLMPGYEKILED